MDYQPIEQPVILSGYRLPEEQDYSDTGLDAPSLSVGYTLDGEESVGANLPLTQLFDNGDLNLFALFMFSDTVDYSAAATVDVYDQGLLEVSAGGGVAYVDEEVKPSINLNVALDVAPSHRVEANSFYDFDNVFTSVGYAFQF